MPDDPLARMQGLLRALFQFDCQNLDFGIYRVLNFKRAPIEDFIQTRPANAAFGAQGRKNTQGRAQAGG